MDARFDMIAIAERWYERGWIGALDLALLRFLSQLEREYDGNNQPLVLLAAVLTSHQLSRGHTCLDLRSVLANPNWYLALPPDDLTEESPSDLPSDLLSGVTLEQWMTALERSSLFQRQDEQTPLVLDAQRVYLRRQWQYETGAAAHLIKGFNQQMQLPGDLKRDLDQLFKRNTDAPTDAQIDWQRVACALATRQRITLITGGPGTGKTTTVVRLLALLQSQYRAQGETLEIALAAPTGKAAARLSDSISGAISALPAGYEAGVPSDVSTLHRLIGVRPDGTGYRHTARDPISADLVVVDEASMIDLELFYALLNAIKPGARLVLLGDKDQLASVEAGAVLGELCSQADTGGYSQATLDWLATLGMDISLWIDSQGRRGEQAVDQAIAMLHTSYRFDADSAIGQLARAVNQGDIAGATGLLSAELPGLSHHRAAQDLEAELGRLVLGNAEPAWGYRPYLETLHALQPDADLLDSESVVNWAVELLERFNLFQVLTPLRRGSTGVIGLNEMIERLLARAELINPQARWYPGRPVLVTENDYALGLMNGDVGICVEVKQQNLTQLRVLFRLANNQLKWVAPSRLGSAETAFAMTVHKSQGSEFSHTLLVLPSRNNPILTRELVYTAITRAKQQFTLLDSTPEVLNRAIAASIERASGLYPRVLA